MNTLLLKQLIKINFPGWLLAFLKKKIEIQNYGI